VILFLLYIIISGAQNYNRSIFSTIPKNDDFIKQKSPFKE